MRQLDEMYVANQRNEHSDRHEAVAKKSPQQVRAIESRKDLRIQLKEDRYHDADVRQQRKDENVNKHCQTIQCVKEYAFLAMERATEIAENRRAHSEHPEYSPDVFLIQDVNGDVNNTIYNIPGKTQGQIFNGIRGLSHFLDIQCNQYAFGEMGRDLNDNKDDFNSPLKDVQPFLTQALQNVLFPRGVYRFDVTKPGFELAGDIMPTVKDTDYIVGSRGFGATTSVNSNGMNQIDMGMGTGEKQKVHEVGHVLENKMNVGDFLKVHRFLRARTRGENVIHRAGWQGMSTLDAYDAYLPEMKIYEDKYGSTPSLSVAAMVGRKINPFQGQRSIDRVFAQKSNSEDTHYATGFYGNDSTELISTTAELFASKTNVGYLINQDPFRAAFFLYMANKDIFRELEEEYENSLLRDRGFVPIPLERVIHVDS